MSLNEIDLVGNENRYYNLVANIFDVVVEVDLKGKFLYVSSQCEQIFGHKPEYYVGKDGFKFIHPEDIHNITEGMKQTFNGETVKLEFRIKKKDGFYAYVSARGNVIEIDGQKRFLAVIRDVTERKAMEEKLNVSKYELLVLNKINTSFLTISDDEVYREILSIILDALRSKYGVFGYIDERGDFVCPSMTKDIWEECQMSNKTNTFPRSSWRGLWGRAMLERDTKYSNENFKVPEGHIQINNALDVPIIYKGDLIGNILIGNKEGDYDNNDIRLLKSIAANISPILYNRLQTERKEQKLNESELNLRERVKELNCLYGISEFAGIQETSIDDIIIDTLNLIPPAWQFPSVTCARITYDGKKSKTLNFKETNWKIDSKIQLLDKILIIEVYYLEDKPFLKEEYDLLRDIGNRLKSIIESKKVEQKLIESEEKYRLIFENSPASISIADLNGHVYTMNKKMSEITGYTIEELNKISFRNIFINPDDLNKALEILNTEGKVRNYLSKLKDKMGREFDALFNIDVINFEGEKLLLTNMEDTRELEDLKASLYEKDLLARIFMENISGFVVLLRPSTRKIIALNKYAKDMGGIPGLTCFNTIGQSETPCPWCLAPNLWKTGEAQHLVVDALDVSWDTYWSPISDDLYLHYGFDVTEQAKREQNLKELNRIKSQLMRRTSHELKTPLVSIKGFTDLLLELKRGELESESSTIVREIKEGCLRLERLINDIIFTSKLEDSQIKLSKSLENLSELINSAVNSLKVFTQTRKQKIQIDILEEMLTMLDKDRILEVLTNLISNAIKYTPKNGNIKLKSKKTEGYFVIMIEDSGIGFTAEEEKNIFTQFGKIERYGQGFDVVSEGSGLGLYIAKKILTQHNGSIWLESEGRNKGTTFFFSLPIIKE
ncbi:hypothetical protein LCGC14_1030110 [marine sediment metagenome]|uniref:histidine kinase n=1 Tax=marine sediment metagenome TaxID=412755 RepID=A0A0F9QCX2_9ZZZZ